MKVFSLSTVNVVITNSTYGQITIGGSGKLLGEVRYGYVNDLFRMQTTPDGGAVFDYNKSLAGTINITFKQTSYHIAELLDFIRWCRNNPQSAESSITITDTLGNIACQASAVFPSKIPDNSVTETASDRTFDFHAGEIISEEAN